jgi:hypothetical protein
MGAKKPKGGRPKTKSRTRANPNTRAKAIAALTYKPVPEPTTLHEAIEALNMWGYYLAKWGQRIDREFHKVEARIRRTTGTPAEHLDPPPEPFK